MSVMLALLLKMLVAVGLGSGMFAICYVAGELYAVMALLAMPFILAYEIIGRRCAQRGRRPCAVFKKRPNPSRPSDRSNVGRAG